MTERCAPDIFANGVPVAVIADRKADAIEEIVLLASATIGIRADWHYVGGRARVLALGDDVERARLRAFLRPFCGGWFVIVEEDGCWTGIDGEER